jgi:hypothetical protein
MAEKPRKSAGVEEHWVGRDGDRDVYFKGIKLGTGTAKDDQAHIYKTEGGKYVAALVESYNSSINRKRSATVATSAEEVAAFFRRSDTKGSGKDRVTTESLNEAGKLALQEAAQVDETFLHHGIEIVN